MADAEPVTLDELYELVEENLKLSKETHRIVRDMRRTSRIAFWFKVILWTAVLVLPFFFLGPILNIFTSYTGLAVPTNTNLFGVPSAEQVQKAVQQFKAQNTAAK